ncbi:MAG: hypothetical protein JW737_04625 [Acidobacteria bacterium]|nr:hypothetical protein [Acidobacteriota bacterium]
MKCIHCGSENTQRYSFYLKEQKNSKKSSKGTLGCLGLILFFLNPLLFLILIIGIIAITAYGVSVVLPVIMVYALGVIALKYYQKDQYICIKCGKKFKILATEQNTDA